jgi:SAM-dependent methyltransferase
MFAPDHPRAAREMLRVVRPGGRIGLASWTPSGFVGEMLRTVGRHVPPIPGVASPALWGKPDHLATLFPGVSQLTSTVRYFAFRYESAAHFVDVFRRYYGPVHKAFAALDAHRQAALEEDLLALLRQADTGGSRGLVVPGEYLETVIVK